METSSFQSKLASELATARRARANGNEGMARVCARRIAGWAIQEHLRLRGVDLNTPSVLDYIRHFQLQIENSVQMQSVLAHMVQPKQRDSLEEDSYWPLQSVDLLAEACWLAGELLGMRLGEGGRGKGGITEGSEKA